jgi:single-stranded-DNA-specific exonuclease
MEAMTTQPAFGVARSFSGRRWVLREATDDAARQLMQAGEVSPVLARILAARGATENDLEDILNPTLKRLLPEPLNLKDMDKAVARVCAAIERGEKIAVFGDYDVDGSASAALMHCFLSEIGRAPRIYIPDRMSEGYGPNAPALLSLKEEGASLVVTVDCGAGAAAALAAARDAGLDVVVLDHHAVETPPPAFAHVNPNQPGDTSGLRHLCAAGVTFLFLVALNRTLREKGWYAANNIPEPDLRAHLDLVGLATICDVVPLTGVNRAFVRAGLARMAQLERPGIAALAIIAEVNAPFTPYHLGFVFGPRINAGGRVGRCSLGVELLTATADTAAFPLGEMLDRHNRERQAIEATILEEAMAMAALQDNQPFVLAANADWHAGVVGIVAGRLKDRFNKPAFVVGFENELGRGSARSVAGVDLGAIIRAARDAGHLEAGGGHAMAAGFSVIRNKLDSFRAFLETRLSEVADAISASRDLKLDAAISPSGASPALVSEIARAGPFGAGNAEPYVVAPDLRVAFADVVGRDHIRLRLVGGDGARLDAIAFRSANTPLGEGLLASRGKPIHAAGRLRADEWQGRVRVQLHLEDAAAAGA